MTGSPIASDNQDAVIEFLSNPASYGAHGDVQRIDTHCSIVFLTADRAYKLKRAIRYASLDYTTRQLRRVACEAELVLNRRTAPDLYLCVRSINRDPSGVVTFDGEGPALDHVVVMRQFAQSDLFDRMMSSARLNPELMQSLGAEMARLHIAAEATPNHGGSEAIRRVIADNDRELVKVTAELDGAAVGVLSSRVRTELDACAALLDRRREEGNVRRCHGDLRLANICLYAGRPTLFDCIESAMVTSPRHEWRGEVTVATSYRRTWRGTDAHASICCTRCRKPDSRGCLPQRGHFICLQTLRSGQMTVRRSAPGCPRRPASPRPRGVDFDRRRGGGFVRFSYCGPEADMREAAARLRRWR